MSTAGSPEEPKRSRWKRWHKIVIGVSGLLLVLIIILIAVDAGDDEEPASDEPAREMPAERTPEPEEEPEAEPEPAPAPRAPPPIERSGVGQRVVEVNLRESTPLVIDAEHSGSANFVVELVGQGRDELAINEIGSYSGQALIREVQSGRYRVSVNADGSWSLTLRQPIPRPRDRALPANLSGQGTTVIPVRVDDDLEPIVAATHRGQANFVVELVGFGDLVGWDLVFNEIGDFEGETLTSMRSGTYLIAVTADGPWTLNFRR